MRRRSNSCGEHRVRRRCHRSGRRRKQKRTQLSSPSLGPARFGSSTERKLERRACRARRLSARLAIPQLSPIEWREVNRIDHERWIAALACDLRHDLTREWKEQAGALNPNQRFDFLLSHIHELK